MNVTLDIKTVIAIGGLIALLGGFYYTTQHRLSVLEEQMQQTLKVSDLQAKEIKLMRRQLRK
jgi:hypothetical protein